MGSLKLLFGKRAKSDDVGLADNPYWDDDDFSLRDRQAAHLDGPKHREAERDTVEEKRRDPEG